MKFENKVILVTGGAGAIGEAIARTFLENGAKVGICDVNIIEGKKVLQKLQKEFGSNKVLFAKCDVTKDADFEAAYNECEQHFGHVDIICNNAAINSKNVETIMAVNFGGVVKGIDLAMKRMGKHNGGKGGIVINIGSTAGLLRLPYIPVYSATKAAVIQYSRGLGHEFHYNYSGVSVLCLCPDIVDTPFSRPEAALNSSYNSHTDAALGELINNLSPAKLTPKEVADAVLQVVEENKSGCVVAIEKGKKPFNVPPSILTEY